jgi:hypothetical protein
VTRSLFSLLALVRHHVRMVRKFDHGYSFRSSESLSQQGRERYRAAGELSEGGHECARGPRCFGYKVVTQPDGTSERVPALTYQVFCLACTGRIVTALRDLPDLYGRLGEEYGSPVRRNDQAVRVPFGPSIPVRLDVDALQREAPPIIGGWAARVRHIPGLQLSGEEHHPSTREGFAEACKVLRMHPEPLFALQPKWMTRTYRLPLDEETEALIGDEEILRGGDDYVTVQMPCDGAAAGHEILRLQWRSTAVLGELRTKPEELLGVPCRADGCGWMTLVRADPPSDPEDPGYYSACLRCRDRMTEPDYREWVALCAAYERNKRREPARLENLPGVA